MAKKQIRLYPKSDREVVAFGQRLKDARLRRRFSKETVCARAQISRPTLDKIEAGDSSASLGNYMQVLRVLGLTEDLSKVAEEDQLGRRLQDESMPQRMRAPRTTRIKRVRDGQEK